MPLLTNCISLRILNEHTIRRRTMQHSLAHEGNLFREGHFKWARIYRRCMHHFGCENDSDSRHGVNAVDERFLTESKENDGN